MVERRLQLREPRLTGGKELGQRFRANAMLARHVVDRREPVFDALELGLVDVDPLSVALQCVGELLQIGLRRLERR